MSRNRLTFITPMFDRLGRRVNMMEQVLDIPGRRSSPRTTRWSRSTGGVLPVLDAAKAAYEVSDLYVAIMQLATTNLPP